MANPKEEEQVEFKVVDRRLFTQDGERRPDVVMEQTKPSREEPPKVPPPPDSRAAQPSPGQAKKSAAASEMRAAPHATHFEQLAMSLLTTAMFQMGLAARPGEPPPAPDLAAAQETIDLLVMLQEKTKGNLTKEEEEILTGGLYELRMAFVEMSRRMGRPVR